MVRVTAYLDEGVVARIKESAMLRGCSRGQIIREAVVEFVERALAARPEPVGLGKFRSGRSDIGGRAEELLRKAVRARFAAD